MHGMWPAVRLLMATLGVHADRIKVRGKKNLKHKKKLASNITQRYNVKLPGKRDSGRSAFITIYSRILTMLMTFGCVFCVFFAASLSWMVAELKRDY